MQLQDVGQAVPRGAYIAQTHARHGIGLRKAIEYNRPFPHIRQFGKGGKLRIAIYQFTIDFITHDDQVVFLDKFCNRQQFFPGHDRPRRVIRVAHDESLRLWRHDFFQRLSCHFKIIFCIGRNENGNAASSLYSSRIGHIGRVGYDDFIPRFGQCQQSHSQPFRSPYSHHNFTNRVVIETIAVME